MNKIFRILFVLVFFISGCSYEPIFISKKYDFKFEEIISEGDINIIVENFSTRGFKEEKKEIFKTKQNRYRTYIKISLNKALIKSFDDYIIESR